MATKSKKWKAVVSFLLFFMGVNLIFGAVWRAAWYLDNGWISLSDLRQDDYQKTERFRWKIAGYLEDFLMMAVDGPIGGYGSSVVVQDGMVTEYSGSSIHTYAVSGTGNWGASDEAVYATAGSVDAASETAAQRRERIDRMHQYYRTDKNVLYRIEYQDKLKYTNAEDWNFHFTGATTAMPDDHYNFLLYFDGEKVSIVKDGKLLDVYGDGIYREDSDWYVPGYLNFAVEGNAAQAKVTIAVAKEPMLFVRGNYEEGMLSHQENGMYWNRKSFLESQSAMRSFLVCLGIGAALLVGAWFLRAEKARADRALARLTARIPVELQVLLALLLLGGLVFLSGASLHLEEFFSYGMFWEESSYEFARSLSYHPGMLLACFWVFYVLVNGIRYTPKENRRHLLQTLRDNLREETLRLPFQKRMVRRFRSLIIEEGLLLCAALAVLWINYIGFYNGWWWISDSIQAFIVFLAMPMAVIVACAFGLLFRFAGQNRSAAEEIGALADQIASIRSGNLASPLRLSEDADLAKASRDLNEIQQGLQEALREQTKSERMKVELVTNVSHDIKTPLTSIISYAEILEQEEDLPAHVREYIQILSSKAQRLKTMVQDVFEVSKAASGQLPVKLERLDLGKLLRQTLADMAERIAAGTVTVKETIPESPVMIVADGQRLYRVFQNLLQNALQYSLEGSRVFITLSTRGALAVASVKNTSRDEIHQDKDFTERFVRGDASRTDGGSGLGLSIASSFTESCGGAFRVESDADLFVVTVEFPLETE